MAASERTRRQIVLESAYDEWVAKPLADPNGQEVVALSKDELAHGLYDCDDVLIKPDTLYEVTAGTLNVRVAPNTNNAPVGSLPLGTQVRGRAADVADWTEITEGEYAGRFVASAYLRPM